MNSPFKIWWTCTILTFLLHVSQCSAQQCNPGDRKALLEFKAGFTVNGMYFETWKEGTNCCEWNGVTCTSTGRVKSLNIDNPVTQAPPSAVAERNTSYQGVLGSTLGDLSELRTLGLSMILFNAPMPDTFHKLKKLESLTMSFNNFSDSLSPSIGAATSLKYLSVGGRGWWPPTPGLPTPAPIPASFCKLVKLQTLQLTSFGLTGTIPSCICRFTQLTELDLSSNSLVSAIPDCISYSLRKLQRLSLATNKFTGPLLPTLGGLTKLETLYFSENQFSASIPPEIGNLLNLQILNLGNNSFSGPVPAALGRLKKLNFLDLSLNSLTQIAPELGQLAMISYLSLASNELQGMLPPEIGNIGSKARSLSFDISNNMLSGSIPNTFGSGKFSTFFAANNRFSGGFPLTLATADSVDLSNNLLGDLEQVGSLPPAPKVGVLNLANNTFSGPLPKWFQDLIASVSVTSIVDISLNKFTGTVPASFLGLPNLWNLNASYNLFDGELPTQSFTPGIGLLDLSHNRISGPITSTFFASLIKAMHLDLSFNELSGPLPANSGDFTDLNYLDLSHNKLNGTVPASVEKIPTLTYLNLSYNNFTGRVPSTTPPPL